METLLIFVVTPLLILAGRANDPSPGIWQKSLSRNLECVRMSQARAHELYPGQVPEPAPRGTQGETDALTCSTRFMPYGERPARDEVILSSLRQSVGEISEVA